jgi:hypothetical protein
LSFASHVDRRHSFRGRLPGEFRGNRNFEFLAENGARRKEGQRGRRQQFEPSREKRGGAIRGANVVELQRYDPPAARLQHKIAALNQPPEHGGRHEGAALGEILYRRNRLAWERARHRLH